MVVTHWVRKNETSRAPNRWIWLDTEAIEEDDDGTRVQTWRLAVTAMDHLNERSRKWMPTVWDRWQTPEPMWDAIDAYTRPGARTIVMAHNMGYDVRISKAISNLRRLQWELVRWQVGDQGCVLRWRKGERSLWLCDSYSWLPKSLAEIGSHVDLEKTPLPDNYDAEDKWWRRCEQDVHILRTAMMHLVLWVRDGDMGNWQPTAGSMAWANWRHKHYTDPVLVHEDEDARTAERAAGWTGRCEAWQHGRLGHGQWTEWDFPLAYPRVCLDTPLPTILRGKVLAPRLQTITEHDDRNRFLCFAEVETDVPTLPYRRDGKILWPVGRFHGWYWDHEIRNAVNEGATVRPFQAYRYQARLALADWAAWVIDAVENPDNGLSGIQKLASKNFARALIGRFGTRYWQWEDWGTDDVDSVRMDWLVDYHTLTVGRLLHVAGKQFGAYEMVDGANSVPCVMSAIMSECRLRLWQAMSVAGHENLSYCDTDSVITTDEGSSNIHLAVRAGLLWGIRAKTQWRNLVVVGPRQLILDGHHRVSGVSRGAQQVGPYEWVGERWEGLTQAAEQGRDDRVLIRPTSWSLTGVDSRREHLDGGRTAPFRVDESPIFS